MNRIQDHIRALNELGGLDVLGSNKTLVPAAGSAKSASATFGQ